MMPKIDLIGQRFGRLTVIEEYQEKKGTNTYWICRCDCGNMTRPIVGPSLRLGRTKSCGCLQKESVVSKNTTHGKYHTKLNGVWNCMKQRCNNPNNQKYHDYGGRGITVCDEWQNSFQTFYNWSMENGYEEGLSIDRIDVDGNYEPSNCRWATMKEQANNKRNSRRKASETRM